MPWLPNSCPSLRILTKSPSLPLTKPPMTMNVALALCSRNNSNTWFTIEFLLPSLQGASSMVSATRPRTCIDDPSKQQIELGINIRIAARLATIRHTCLITAPFMRWPSRAERGTNGALPASMSLSTALHELRCARRRCTCRTAATPAPLGSSAPVPQRTGTPTGSKSTLDHHEDSYRSIAKPSVGKACQLTPPQQCVPRVHWFLKTCGNEAFRITCRLMISRFLRLCMSRKPLFSATGEPAGQNSAAEHQEPRNAANASSSESYRALMTARPSCFRTTQGTPNFESNVPSREIASPLCAIAAAGARNSRTSASWAV
mmetsp:Transcript_21806/g.64960  ORF Transcript_21806/g.64960 Transcript_21806/m.64960 type:complete len:317 (-) Transcript_21806:9-959(-)